MIVGCGCRGQALTRVLREEGHAVRGTTRDPARAEAIETAGAESHIGDPDRIGTLTAALDGATILCWLLGSAVGPPDTVAPLHGTRLGMLLERAIDTTVRGVLYEAAGSLDPALLAAGGRVVEEACRRSQIPYRLVASDPADHTAWLADARAGVEELLR